MKNMPYIIRHVRGSIEFICLSDSITSVICGWPHENGRVDWSHRTRDSAAYLFYSAALSAALEQYCGITKYILDLCWTWANYQSLSCNDVLLNLYTLKLASVYFFYHFTKHQTRRKDMYPLKHDTRDVSRLVPKRNQLYVVDSSAPESV